MIKKFTEQDMHDYADYVIKARRMLVEPKLSLWYVEKNKPTKKTIDLSVLIDSQIDCEFSEGISWFFSTLKHHSNGVYMDVTSSVWDKCKPRMNHKHAWQGGECPLPEGFEVKVWYRDDSRCTDTLLNSGVYTNTGWVHRNNGRDIIAFEVLGVADGYVMPWEVSDDF